MGAVAGGIGGVRETLADAARDGCHAVGAAGSGRVEPAGGGIDVVGDVDVGVGVGEVEAGQPLDGTGGDIVDIG
ncbi:MAG: hypothetical protein GEV09_28655 [Pseudonocardiaceae bacterium]|nr:hypothetical protein [Pseudonocardiaceae bacterium]